MFGYRGPWPEFRRGPIPYSGRRFRGYGCCMRHPRTTQERRILRGDPQYSRARRRNIPTAWDDQIRHLERSWKRQSRARHQWESVFSRGGQQ